MPRHHHLITHLVAFVAFFLVLLPPWSNHAGAGAPALVVVIVADSSTVKDVSRMELRKLFLRNTSSVGGQSMIPLNHPAKSDTRVRFDKLVLGMNEAEVGRYWIDRRVRGESGPPRVVQPADLLKEVVSRLPGAISYVRSDQVDNKVRVLTIDGKGPSHPDYPLK
jgi:ABC-type phosphate transport system substrate-binding protein